MKKVLRRFWSRCLNGEKGFTLIELLVVVAILGILALIAVPNVGKFIGTGKQQSYDTELHNVQTAVMAMMVEAASGKVDSPVGAPGTSDLSSVTSLAPDGTTLHVSDYLTGLDAGVARTNCLYQVGSTGTVIQTPPAP